MNSKLSAGIEKWSRVLAYACAIHCVAVPIVLLLFPLISMNWGASLHHFEAYIFLPAWFVASLIFIKDYRKHKKALPIILLSLAMVSFGGFYVDGKTMPLLHQAHHLAGVFLAGGYWFNHKVSHKCSVCEGKTCEKS